MRMLHWYKRTALAMLLVALLSLFSLSSALADEDQSVKEKIKQLEMQIDDLESLVKALTLQVQRVSENVVGDLENFRPRLFTVENLTKDNTFEIKKLSGSVARLSEAVEALSELPEQVAYLKATVKELSAKLDQSLTTLTNRIAANELGLTKLQEAVERAMTLTMAFQQSLGMVLNRLDVAEGALAQLQLGHQEVAARVEDLEVRISKLGEVAAQIDTLSAMVSQLHVQLAEFSARQEKAEARLAQLRDMVEQLSMVVRQHAAEIEGIKAQMGAPQDSNLRERVDRLERKVNEVVETTQMTIMTIKEEIKREVVAAIKIPRVPTEEEIRLQVEEITAKQIKEAQARADAAQGLAIVSLLAAMAAIVAALLL